MLGSALTVLAPPVGIFFLVRVVGSLAVLAGVGALASHFWNNVAQDDLRRMSELLESGQAALVVVASDRDGSEIERLLAHAGTTLVAKTTADFDVDFHRGVKVARGVDSATVASRTYCRAIATCHLSSGVMRWSLSSLPASSCTQLTVPVKWLSSGV